MDAVTHFGLSQNPFRAPEPRSLAGGALTPEAARAYLAGRIAGAGGPDLFSPAALDTLAAAANGDPDLLRRLGGSALFHAASQGARRVEDQHARQAAATHGNPLPPDALRAAPAMVSVATPAAPAHTLGTATPAADAVLADPVAVHRRWWRRTPPMIRLAIIVGLLLLSLPVIGYIVGVVKDSQSSGSSYLPDDSIVDAKRITPAEADVVDGINPEAVAATSALAAAPARSPVRLPPATATPFPASRVVAPPEPMLEAPIDPEPTPVAEPESVPAEEPVVPTPQLETVPIDPPAAPAVEEPAPTPQA